MSTLKLLLIPIRNHRLNLMQLRIKAPQLDLLSLGRFNCMSVRIQPLITRHIRALFRVCQNVEYGWFRECGEERVGSYYLFDDCAYLGLDFGFGFWRDAGWVGNG
jgi:hypothetical protein